METVHPLYIYTLFLLACGACAAAHPDEERPAPAAGRIPVDGGTLYYETAGTGRPVVLIHGGFGDRPMWDDQFEALARSLFVVRYDHRGFGESTPPSGPYSPVADLRRLLDELSLSSAHLVGNSMGGTLALDFALLHPERTDKVVVVSSSASGYPVPDDAATSVMEVFTAARDRGTAQAADLWLKHPMVAVASRHPAAAPRLREMVVSNQRVFLMEHWPEEPMQPPAFERLSSLRIPALFIVGERDTPFVRESAQASAARIPGGRFEIVPGTDHLPQMEEPGRVTALIDGFLNAP